MDHAGGHDLDPAGVFAEGTTFLLANSAGNESLDTGFDEGEIGGVEADFDTFPVEAAQDKLHGTKKVSHVDVFVDQKTVDLPKFEAVGGVNVVDTVAFARHDATHRRFGFFENFDLHTGNLSLQNEFAGRRFSIPGVEIEGDLSVAGRGVFGHV